VSQISADISCPLPLSFRYLTLKQQLDTIGTYPRHFSILPGAVGLIVAHQPENSLET